MQRKRRVGKRQPQKPEQPERSKPEQPTRPLPQNPPVEFLPSGGSYGPNAEGTIREALANIVFSDKCAEAFKAANLKTPFELLMKGIVIGPATLLNNPANNQQNGITEGVRRFYQKLGAVGSRSVQAFTINNIPGQPMATTDARARIFLNTSAFGGGSYPLREVLAHELIHVAGVLPQPGILGSLGISHDLNGYEHYESIINACK